MTSKPAATMTYTSTADTGTQAGSPLVVWSDCRGRPSDKETQTADDTIIENRPENQVKFLQDETYEQIAPKKMTTEETVEANNTVPGVEEPFIKEELLTDESAANLGKFVWEAVPKVASAIAIANDYRNGGITKIIAGKSADVITNGVEKMKENIHKHVIKNGVEKTKENIHKHVIKNGDEKTKVYIHKQPKNKPEDDDH